MFRGLSLSKVALKSKFPAKLGGAFPDCNKAFVIDSDAQIFMYLIHCIHVTLLYWISICWVRLMKSSAFEPP